MQHDLSMMRIKEIVAVTGQHMPAVTKYFKARPEGEVVKNSHKIVGVKPAGVEHLFQKRGYINMYRPGVYLINSQCGGVSKTTSTINLAFAFARMSDRDNYPVVIVDADTQSSLTAQIHSVDEDSPVLVDFVEGKVKKLRDIAVEIEKNVYLIPGSLDNGYLEKEVSTAKKTKEVGKNILDALFDEFAIEGRLKVFIDSPPAMSPVTQSFMFAINSLPEGYDRAICIPIRPDSNGIRGCDMCIVEYESLLTTFNVKGRTQIHPFISFFESRTNNAVAAMKLAFDNTTIKRYGLSPVVIKTSALIANKMMRKSHIYSSQEYKPNQITQDYFDLLVNVLGGAQKHEN